MVTVIVSVDIKVISPLFIEEITTNQIIKGSLFNYSVNIPAAFHVSLNYNAEGKEKIAHQICCFMLKPYLFMLVLSDDVHAAIKIIFMKMRARKNSNEIAAWRRDSTAHRGSSVTSSSDFNSLQI